MLPTSSKQSVYSLLKPSIFIVACVLIIGNTAPQSETTTTLLTFNIRYDNPGDGNDAWPNRSSWVAAVIDSSGASIVGLQEALGHQLREVVRFAPRFAFVGVGRDDGVDAGEYSPLLYDSSVWKVTSWQTRWLSPDSSAVGIAGWDAALPRIATIADFKHLESNSSLRVINTHFDHRGAQARLESARLIRKWAAEVEGPVVVLGDFNLEDNTPAYQQLTGLGSQLGMKGTGLEAGLKDVGGLFQKADTPTFRGFDSNNTLGPRIDYIFVNQEVTALSYDVLAPSRNGRFPSDHLPLKVAVRW
ncbi:MAG: endonuclease/exonuclease/phosphatase family protein [Bacteroidetes bacterium]|nr:endonuclease/exonuclease/phosphatase family protein [Bacteroidota bacterium]